MKQSEPRIEFVPVDEIARWPGNPKEHDIPELETSFARWGLVGGVLYDETTQRLVAGHGRLEALEARKLKGESPPPGIKVLSDGRWSVAVIRGVAFDNEDEALAFLIADNRHAQLGGWDNGKLGAALARLKESTKGLVGVGFDRKAIDAVTKRLSKTIAEAAALPGDADSVPDAPEKPSRKQKAAKEFRVLIKAEDADDQRKIMDELADLGYEPLADTI